MKRIASFVLMVLALFLGSVAAEARVVAKVDVARQKMVVTVDGQVKHVWHVSTGKRGYGTPRGSYSPKSLKKVYYSKKYYNSPMPYSIFFKGGYAVHGTNSISKLGAPASHGCIRLATSNAARLFSLVQQHGRSSAKIVIT